MIEDPKLTLKILRLVGSEKFLPGGDLQEIYSSFPKVSHRFLKHHVVNAADAGLIRCDVVQTPVMGGISVHVNPIEGLTPEGHNYIRRNQKISPALWKWMAGVVSAVLAGLLILYLSRFLPT